MKKFIKYFILVLTICSIFTLSVFANAVVDEGVVGVYTVGAPFHLYASYYVNDQQYDVLQTNPNVYIHGRDGFRPAWKESVNTDTYCTLSYGDIATPAADIFAQYNYSMSLNGIAVNDAIYLNSTSDYEYLTATLGLYKPHFWLNGLNNPEYAENDVFYYDQIKVIYTYRVIGYEVPYDEFDASNDLTTYVVQIEEMIPVFGEYAYVQLFPQNHISKLLSEYGMFYAENTYDKMCWIEGFGLSFEGSPPFPPLSAINIDTYVLDNFLWSIAPTTKQRLTKRI